MWLLKNLSQNNNKSKTADKGTVTVSNQSTLSVKSSSEHIGIPVVTPYGYKSIPPAGENIFVLPVGQSNVCIGTACNDFKIEESEIMLSSKGGATLILKNDGRILANGVEISKKKG